jgi:ribosome-associated toxin RatA of RatAB toxin-antitoxin module
MRLLARRVGLCAIVASFLVQGVTPPSFSATLEETDRLDVHSESTGGVRATASMLFPAPVSVVQAILTDYAHWPELFEGRMRVADLKVQEGVTTTDVRIEHALLPGERRLVTESRLISNGELVADLKGGDFKRYHRRWKLTSADAGAQTRAEFELVFEIDSVAPDWLVSLATRRDLAAHFRLVKEKAAVRAKELQSGRSQ